MVNLNRQIRATQARQGGFSAHVLPSPVGYQQVGVWTYAPDELLGIRSPYGQLAASLVSDGSDPFRITPDFGKVAAGPYAGAASARLLFTKEAIGVTTGIASVVSSQDSSLRLNGGDKLTLEAYLEAVVHDPFTSVTAASEIRDSVGGASVGFYLHVQRDETNFPQFPAPWYVYCGVYVDAVSSRTELFYDGYFSSNVLPGFRHLALTIDGGEGRFFLDGQPPSGFDTQPTSNVFSISEPEEIHSAAFDTFEPFWVDARPRGQTSSLDFEVSARAHMVRFSHLARYATNFTPPQL